MNLNLLDRIGIDIGRRLPLEDAIAWAAQHGVKHIDIQLDTAANAITSFDDARCARVRALLEKNGVHLALHTLSAVNVAEYSPYVGEGVADTYYESGTNLWDVAAGLAIIKAAGGHYRLVPTGKRPLNYDLWASAREEWTR